jgi:hypothetical protein
MAQAPPWSLISSIEPRLYLMTRMIMDVAQDKAPGVGR